MSLLFLILGLEGIFCLVMAAPLIAVMATIGGTIGGLLRRQWEHPNQGALLLFLEIVPLLLAWEHPVVDPTQPIAVTTDIIVRATPEAVWKQTVDFAPITTPPSGLLRFGVAYSTHAVLRKDGDQLIRECHCTTGPFIEPITLWDPPTSFGFRRRFITTVDERIESLEHLSTASG